MAARRVQLDFSALRVREQACSPAGHAAQRAFDVGDELAPIVCAGGEAAGKLEQRVEILVRTPELLVRLTHLLDRRARLRQVLANRDHHEGGREREGDEAGQADLVIGDHERERERP